MAEENKLRAMMQGREPDPKEPTENATPQLTIAKGKTKADAEPLAQMTVRLPMSLAAELREAAKLLAPRGESIQSLLQNAVRKELRSHAKEIQQMREVLGGQDNSVS